MADTQRTRAQILALMADNVTGQISPQDFRDFIVTLMETPEFTYAGDFFNGPVVARITTDKTTRGFHIYSQTMNDNHSASFGQPLALDESGYWVPADVSRISCNPARGIAADSYASGATNVKILIKGIIYDSGLSHMSGQQGKPMYLGSGAVSTSGHVSVTIHTSGSANGIVGYVLGSTAGYESTYKWHFDGTGNWGIIGV